MKRWLHNFICGAGTLLEIMPPPPRHLTASTRATLSKSDAELLYGDWEKVGADFWAALGKVGNEHDGTGPAPGRRSADARTPA